MKVIDLLNKIANGEEVPKKIKWNLLVKDYQILIYDEEQQEYVFENNKDEVYSFPLHHLNDELEIIEDTPKEDKNIEKLDLSDWWEITSDEDCKPEMLAKIFNKNAKAFSSKINEIIDKINGDEKDEN